MTFEKVKEIVAEQLGVGTENIKLESRLKEDLEADSLDAVEIAISIEDSFGIEMPDDELAKLSTVGDKVNFVDGYGKWAKGIQEWLSPALNDFGTIQFFLAFIIQIPLILIAYVLEGIWWLISWVILGIVKLVILLVGKIIFVIPFILYGGGVAIDVILLAKCDYKDTSFVVSFILSLILCLVFGILILV